MKEKECRARVEFQSKEYLKLDKEVISSGQGSLVCRYPNGPCQLANKKGSGFLTRLVDGQCKVESNNK